MGNETCREKITRRSRLGRAEKTDLTKIWHQDMSIDIKTDDIKTVTKLPLKDLRETTRDREKWRMKIITITKCRRRIDGTR